MRWLHGCTSVLTLARLVTSYSPLSDDTLQSLRSPGNDFDIHTGDLLSPILIPRVPGTSGSTKVLNHFLDFFRDSLPLWTLSFQNSSFTTPLSDGKDVPFVNLIATRDPPGTEPGSVGRLVLVAHYDSKISPEGFIGATDSAAPCAMLMHIARSIDQALTDKWASRDELDDADDTGVQILLLDGEEAFKEWTATDSVYGARALAAQWDQTFHTYGSKYRTPLDAIDLFVLLDLLGATGPNVPSYFKTTHWAYKHMATIESRLRKLGLLTSSPNHKSKRSSNSPRAQEPVFLPESNKQEDAHWLGGLMLDDHMPFLHLGVDVLHIIPVNFPSVWHKIEDDGEHLDMDTVTDWTSIVLAFAAEWMDLDAFMKPAPRIDSPQLDAKDEL